MNNNAFNKQRYDLGASGTGEAGKADIDAAFKNPNTPATPCIFCTNPANHRIVPKNSKDNTAEIEDKGFVCEHCLKQGYLDKNRYGIRPY